MVGPLALSGNIRVNPCLVGVSPADMKQYDLSELANAALSLEYNVATPEVSPNFLHHEKVHGACERGE
jgi:hypothetical protein